MCHATKGSASMLGISSFNRLKAPSASKAFIYRVELAWLVNATYIRICAWARTTSGGFLNRRNNPGHVRRLASIPEIHTYQSFRYILIQLPKQTKKSSPLARMSLLMYTTIYAGVDETEHCWRRYRFLHPRQRKYHRITYLASTKKTILAFQS